MVRKTKPTDEARLISAENVQFHCYDIIDETMTFEERNEWIESNLQESYCVDLVSTSKITAEPAAKMTHKINLANGYEGSIVRTNGTYQCKRSHNLRKFKDFHDAEAEIIGWVEGKGKRRGTIGKFIAADKDGNRFGMPVMDKFKYLQDNFEEMQTWKGKIATFTYFERTKANSYRHPLFKAIRDYE
jgi:DNA ligase-1